MPLDATLLWTHFADIYAVISVVHAAPLKSGLYPCHKNAENASDFSKKKTKQRKVEAGACTLTHVLF
ncbi:hypothetical protein BDF20DRAFT_855201 [Mycotypha africana]|uniref:uncharacterized protein n=1 Tax=Mycotypha africana TaxID=64632 RepID=UPI00230036D4|nr:uncharacterized protein BDF20DRAFT_855201 [Mycotypha africana]KAI8988340.1 hypothetical protein BDF20DRAFT_855201 [Mycotypha africana]